MRAGKLSQTVWRRSVQKQLYKEKEQFLLHPSAEEMCTAIRTDAGTVMLTASASVSGSAPDVGIYAAAKAVNDLASRGAMPMGVSLQILLPVSAEEEELKEGIRRIGMFCRENGIPIAGMQAEVSASICQIIVQAAALGEAQESALVFPSKAGMGQDIVLCGYVGLEGTLRILDECRGELENRFSPSFFRQQAMRKNRLIQINAIKTACHLQIVSMQQIGSGGILGTLWELAEAAGVGLEVELEKMSIRQETIEICEYYQLNPYQLTSAGSILMVTGSGEKLVKALEESGARASMLGVTTAGNARVVTSRGERRFLDRPAPDELALWWERRMRHSSDGSFMLQ